MNDTDRDVATVIAASTLYNASTLRAIGLEGEADRLAAVAEAIRVAAMPYPRTYRDGRAMAVPKVELPEHEA